MGPKAACPRLLIFSIRGGGISFKMELARCAWESNASSLCLVFSVRARVAFRELNDRQGREIV
jgi:hypothetical protein